VLPVRDFSVEEIFKARQMRTQYQAAYLFSTKYETVPWIKSELWEKLNRRYFDYHRDVSPDLAAEFLGGKIVLVAKDKAEWVSVMEMEQPASVASAGKRPM